MTQSIDTVVSAVLRDNQGRILLARRPVGKTRPFLWEFPGGKIEMGESPEEALRRALYEEITILVSPQHFKPLTFGSVAYPDFHLILLGYHCIEWEGVPCAREDQSGIEWVMPKDLDQYPMPKANHPLIDLLQDRAKIEV